MSRSESRDSAPVAAPATTRLVLVLYGEELAAWHLAPGKAPHPLSLQGQTRLRVETSRAIVSACDDVAERLRGDGTTVDEVHWLADEAGRQLWAGILPQLQESLGSPRWQLLAWEWLAGRFGLTDSQPWATPGLLESELLPWLVTADNATERRQMQERLASEHHVVAGRLTADRAQLQQENERLRAQNVALQQVDAERLLCFLPALYPRVFTVLGATDLALLCRRVEPLPIPNPYPEPSEETVHTLQKDFRALPRALQQQIVRFVARLPQRQKLQPRSEMRVLLQDLEKD